MNLKFHLEEKTIKNDNYRNVIYTDKNSQLVLMSLNVNEYIPLEKHKITTQFFKIENGNAIVYIEDKRYLLKKGDSIFIPPNTLHMVKQSGSKKLKLYTIYTPPEHPIGTLHKRQQNF
jgi:mannose-6-phosphate isomerase-like protein (cupin superfamily)